MIASDSRYHIQKPSYQSFDDCCNEFWMTSTYVAKGLARKEILFAVEIMNDPFHQNLLTMLRWKIGIDTDFSLSIGKSDKFLQKYVSDATWNTLISTYDMSSYEKMWDALFTSFELFRETSHFVAETLGFSYPDYDRKVSGYIDGIRQRYF